MIAVTNSVFSNNNENGLSHTGDNLLSSIVTYSNTLSSNMYQIIHGSGIESI